MAVPTRPSSRVSEDTGSFAAINGHPIHPLLVPVAIGMYVAAVCADVAFARTGDPFWAQGTSWLLFGTIASALVAAIPGVVDLLSIDRASRLPVAWAHASGNVLFLILVVFNYSLRHAGPPTAGRGGLLLSFAGLVVLGISGWLGGEMTYRHGIGRPAPAGTREAPGAAPGTAAREGLSGD